MFYLLICIFLIPLSLYIGYKHGRNVERINQNHRVGGIDKSDSLFIKDDKCEHDWKLFSSGYKQCKKCRSIVKNN